MTAKEIKEAVANEKSKLPLDGRATNKKLKQSLRWGLANFKKTLEVEAELKKLKRSKQHSDLSLLFFSHFISLIPIFLFYLFILFSLSLSFLFLLSLPLSCEQIDSDQLV